MHAVSELQLVWTLCLGTPVRLNNSHRTLTSIGRPEYLAHPYTRDTRPRVHAVNDSPLLTSHDDCYSDGSLIQYTRLT